MNMYNRFAYLYDELMNDFDYENWFRYIEEIFIKYDKSPKEILEMACGTGNLAYYFAEKGYKLTCFDLSDEMLSLAYEKLIEFPNVKLFNQNMIDFNFNKKFNAVVSICDSINYITSKKDLSKVFKNVLHHMDENGIFIFDINSYYKLREIIGNNTFVEDRNNIFYSWENYYDEEEDICDFYLTFFVKGDKEKYIRFDEEHREKAYKIKDIINILKEVGFTKVDYFEAFTFNKPKENTERINFVAMR